VSHRGGCCWASGTREHEIVVWKAFPFVVEAGEDQFVLPEGMPKIPMSFSIGATKR
jgi:hypothetical protein